MKTTALAPMTLSDELLTSVAGGSKKHGRCFPRRGLGRGHGPKFVTNIDVDVDIDVYAGRGSSVDVDVDIDINVGR